MNERFRIVAANESKRLDVFLSEHLAIPRSKAKRMVDEGYVTADGRKPKVSSLVRPSMVIEGEIPPEEPLNLTPEEIPLQILYEDECLLAINKEAGMVVHPACGHRSGTLVNAVLSHLGDGRWEMGDGAVEIQNSKFITYNSRPDDAAAALRPGIVHRLDKGTTGVILIAKNARTQEHLAALFKRRSMQKTYRAVVEGFIRESRGTIEGNIGRHPVDRKKMAVLTGRGREAVTDFAVVERLNGFTVVEAYPKTGRTHQIRVHFGHIGHPVVGDAAYGKKARTMVARPLLHAYRISFPHPGTGEPLTIEAPIPTDMKEFAETHAHAV